MLNEIKILGIKCHLFTQASLNELVVAKVKAKEKIVIAHQNLHGVYIFQKNRHFRDFYQQANFVHIDGMPLVYWAKALGYKANSSNRITYVDWMGSLMEHANFHRLRIFFLGGEPGMGRLAIAELRKKYGAICFDEHHGFFDMQNSADNTAVLQAINRFAPHILMVGMGMPRQEIWISNNLQKLPNCVVLPCGACFDYIGGKVKTPPRYLGRIGLEWLYRFKQEPRRLFFRYFIEPVYLLPLLLKDLHKAFWANNRRKGY